MTTRTRIIATASGMLSLASLALALPAFAQTPSASVTAGAAASARMMRLASSTREADPAAHHTQSIQQGMQNAQDKGGTLIDQRIASLNALLTRIQAMKNVSAADKTSFSSSLQAEIASLTTLKAQIAADTSTTTLRADVSSITKSFRIYALVEPQTAIAAAADRVGTITGMLATIATKIQARLTAPNIANLAALQADLADINAKTADANTQAQAAVSEVASLQPDNGDATLMASNTAALKDARSKIQAATKDLTAARADVNAILQGLKASDRTSTSTSASASVSASTTTQ